MKAYKHHVFYVHAGQDSRYLAEHGIDPRDAEVMAQAYQKAGANPDCGAARKAAEALDRLSLPAENLLADVDHYRDWISTNRRVEKREVREVAQKRVEVERDLDDFTARCQTRGDSQYDPEYRTKSVRWKSLKALLDQFSPDP